MNSETLAPYLQTIPLSSVSPIMMTAFSLAQRFINIPEAPGSASNPQILAMLKLDQEWPEGDEVPWCSAFVNYIAWLLRLPRSKSLRARSWLHVGSAVQPDEAWPGFDVVVLTRGAGKQPGPDVIDAPGHVGFLAGSGVDNEGNFYVLGGNQGDSINVRPYPTARLLGIRRLAE